MALWAIAWVGRFRSILSDKFVQLLADHAMVSFRHHSSRTPPSCSPILEYRTSDLSPSGRFSSTRYSPHSCPTKVLFDFAFEYSVPVMFIVRFSFVSINHRIQPLTSSVTLGLTFDPTTPGSPQHYSSWHAMTGFGVLLGTNLLGLAVVIIRGDIVWCVAATWIAVSIWSAKPKPPPVYVSDMSIYKEKRKTQRKTDHGHTFHCPSSPWAACGFRVFPDLWSWSCSFTTRR